MGKRATLVALLVLGIPLVALALTFTTIDVPGSRNTAPQGVNARGDIVGFSTDNTTNRAHGFLLSDGTFTEVNFPGFLQTAPRGINDRSEERRVGKECRSRWGAYQSKKKKK